MPWPTTTTASRVARLHARVAHALADGGAVAGLVGPEERVAELARHWLAAGSVVRRARLAGRRRRGRAGPAHLLLGGGRAAGGGGHRGTPARPARHPRGADRPAADPGARLPPQLRSGTRCCPCAAEAIALARREEDLPRLVAAAAAASDNLVWTLAAVERGAGGHRRRPALGPRPDVDRATPPDRCRLMLALAVQLYYEPGRPRRARGAGRGGVRDGAAASATPRCSGGPPTPRGRRCGPRPTARPGCRSRGRGSRRPGPAATRTPRPWRSWCWPGPRWRWATGRPTHRPPRRPSGWPDAVATPMR